MQVYRLVGLLVLLCAVVLSAVISPDSDEEEEAIVAYNFRDDGIQLIDDEYDLDLEFEKRNDNDDSDENDDNDDTALDQEKRNLYQATSSPTAWSTSATGTGSTGPSGSATTGSVGSTAGSTFPPSSGGTTGTGPTVSSSGPSAGTASTGSAPSATPTIGGGNRRRRRRRRDGCWYQLPDRRWIWNNQLQYPDKCGGWVQLPNFQWIWTEHPDWYPQMYILPGGGGYGGGGSGGDGSGGDGSGGDGSGGDGGGGYPVTEPAVITEEAQTPPPTGNAGAGGGEPCDCTAWTFPGECGADDLRFRWRTCNPRYCEVEDEYIRCGEKFDDEE